MTTIIFIITVVIIVINIITVFDSTVLSGPQPSLIFLI